MEENTPLVNQTIAKNLIYYRKRAGFTQAELAQKLNYSDKSISKWESGAGVPDIYILIQLATLYGVTVNDLVGETPKKEPKTTYKRLQIMIMLLSAGLAVLCATCIFVLLELLAHVDWAWLMFIYAVPAVSIVTLVLASVWKYKVINFISTSTLIWSALTAIFLTLLLIVQNNGGNTGPLGLLFVIGAPLQVLTILWAFFRYSNFKIKGEKPKKKKKKNKDEN